MILYLSQIQISYTYASVVDKRGGSGGRLPLSGFGPPLLLPLSNHCLPHSTIFEFDSPTWNKFHSLPQKFWLPYLKIFVFCKKGPTSRVQFWALLLSEFLSWTLLPEKFMIWIKGETPLVEFSLFEKSCLTPLIVGSWETLRVYERLRESSEGLRGPLKTP